MNKYTVSELVKAMDHSDDVVIAVPDVRDVPDELRIVDEKFYKYITKEDQAVADVITKEDQAVPEHLTPLATIAERFGIPAAPPDVFNILTTYYSYCVDSRENKGLGLDEQVAVTEAIAFAIKCQEALKFEKKLLDLQAQVHENSQREHDISSLQGHLDDSYLSQEFIEEEARHLDSQVGDLKRALLRLEKNYAEKERLLLGLQKQLTEKREEISSLQQKVVAGEKSQTELEDAQSELSHLREAIAENEKVLVSERKRFKEELSSLQEQLQDVAELNEQLARAKRTAEEASEQLSGELDQSRQEMAKALQSAGDINDVLSQAEDNNRSLERKNAELTSELENLRNQLSALREPQAASTDLASELARAESVSSQTHSSVKSEGVAVNYQAIIEKLEAVSKNEIPLAQNIKGVAIGILPFVKAANKLQIQNRDQSLDLAGLRAIFAEANLNEDSATSIFAKLAFDNKEAIKGFLQGDGEQVPQDLEVLNKRPQQVAELLSSLSTAAIAVAADKSREFAGGQLRASNDVVAVAVAAEYMNAQLRYLQRESEIEGKLKAALDEQKRLHQDRVDELERRQAAKLAALEKEKEGLVEQLKASQSERERQGRDLLTVKDELAKSGATVEDLSARLTEFEAANNELKLELQQARVSQDEIDRLRVVNSGYESKLASQEELLESQAAELAALKRPKTNSVAVNAVSISDSGNESMSDAETSKRKRGGSLRNTNIQLRKSLEKLQSEMDRLTLANAEQESLKQQAEERASLAEERATEQEKLKREAEEKARLAEERASLAEERATEQEKLRQKAEEQAELDRQRADALIATNIALNQHLEELKLELGQLNENLTEQQEALDGATLANEFQASELKKLRAAITEEKNETSTLNALLDGRDIDADARETLIAQLKAELDESQVKNRSLIDESDATRQRIADLEAQLAKRDSGQLVAYNPDAGKDGPTFTFNVPPGLFNLLSDQAVMDALTKENQELRGLVARLLSQTKVVTAPEEDGAMTPFEFKASPQDIKNFLLLLTQIREVQVPSVIVEDVTEIERLTAELKKAQQDAAELERLKAQVESDRDGALTRERAKAGEVAEFQQRLSSINTRFFDQTISYDEEARLKEEAQQRALLAEHRNQGLVAENTDLRAILEDLQAQLAAAQKEKRQVKVATTEVGVGTDSDPSTSLPFGKDPPEDVDHGRRVPRTGDRAFSTFTLQAETDLEQQATDFYDAIVAMTKKINARDIDNLKAERGDVFSAVSSDDKGHKSVLDYSLTANPNAQYRFEQKSDKDAKIQLMTNRFERSKLNSLLKIFTGLDINDNPPPAYLKKGCAEGENPFAKNSANNIAVIAFANQLGVVGGDIPNLNNNTEEEISSLSQKAQDALKAKFPDISVALKEVASKFYPRAHDHIRRDRVDAQGARKPSTAVSIINADQIHDKLQQAESKHYGASSRA